MNSPEPHPRHEEFSEKLMAIANAIASDPSGRARVAFQEADETTDHTPDANHFIKVDEKRLGRDIPLYSFMAKLGNWESTLCDVLAEIIKPLEKTGLSVYPEAKKMLKELGYEIYNPAQRKSWDELLKF